MFTRYLKIMMACALLLAALCPPGAQAAEEMKMEDIKVLNFGIISTDSAQNLKAEWEPFLKDMEKSLGIPVKAFFAGDYAGVIEAMRFNKVQLAWFGNKSAIEAVDRSNGEVFAQQVSADGEPGYWSLLITHKDSPLNSVEDVIKNGSQLNFGNGDVNSTSGYLIPSYYLWAQHKIDPKTHFKTVRNTNHAANIMAVVTKQVDFATNNTEQYKNFRRTQPEQAENIKILWKSPLIPKDPLVWRKDLPRELKSQVKAFVLSYGRIGPEAARQREVLSKISGGMAPFWDSSNKQLVPIREIMFAKQIDKINNDQHMSAEQKQEQIAALRKELTNIKNFGSYLEKY
jgi:phosphonate transport system substrate-binding protein